MNLKDLSNELDELWEETTRFDYVDRTIVFIFLLFNLVVGVVVMNEHLPKSHWEEIAPIMDGMGFISFFFFIWPLVYLGILGLVEYASEKVKRWRAAP